jgi:hypothetical protein
MPGRRLTLALARTVRGVIEAAGGRVVPLSKLVR